MLDRIAVVRELDPMSGAPLIPEYVSLAKMLRGAPGEFAGAGTQSGAISMEQVALISIPSLNVIAGLDLDHDGLREFGAKQFSPNVFRVEFHESIGDDAFSLEHVYEPSVVSFGLYDFGDADGDGLSEMTTASQDLPGGVVRIKLVESLSSSTFPTETIWETTASGSLPAIMIADSDGDGKKEVIVVARPESLTTTHVRIFENSADNSFTPTLDLDLPQFELTQSAAPMADFDGDSRNEILVGGIIASGAQLMMIESVSDDSYSIVWTDHLTHNGILVNASKIVEAGDLDNDGKKEFVVAGLRPMGAGDPNLIVAHVYEAVGNNDIQLVETFAYPFGSLDGDTVLTVADVDGDGRAEIVLGSGNLVRIQKNIADNSWTEISRISTGWVRGAGAGDHDQDGKAELVISEGGFDGVTSINEIDPADAIDSDGDGPVDAIDNCPSQFNPGQSDLDSDALGDLCDNCVFGPNPMQGPAVLGQELTASGKTVFVWSNPADVVFVRGEIAHVGEYTTGQQGALVLAQQLTDFESPLTGGGFYYLVQPDCPVGSWQSSPGAEPGRDVALP